jgi:hypothetical protein
MNESLVALAGRRLSLDEYLEDYGARFAKLRGGGTWKIERQQEFAEPGEASWEAFARGDWSGALRLLNEMRPALVDFFGDVSRKGARIRRVRVVELPISPYLIWELNVLRVRAECGEHIRVVEPESIESLEREDTLPEILVLGTETVYQVLYGEDGAAEGAILSTERDIVSRWTAVAEGLYAKGEELSRFFAKKVAGLRPPDVL